jgi:tRNA threonylcarbamoyladenosine biosynthesis protein TsaB
MIIAIDTSTNMAGLAIVGDGSVVAEMTWYCGQNHTTQLLPALHFMLQQEGLELSQATAIVVARGPGSYNGLRVGLGTAKGLAFSLNIPVVGISTLETEAYQASAAGCGLPVCALFNAGRGEIAAAVYQMKGKSWQQVEAEHLTTVSALCAAIIETTVFCGDYLPKVALAIEQTLGNKAILVSPAGIPRRAAYLAELGQKRLQVKDFDDPAALQPLYLRGPAITQPKEPYEMADR